MSQQPERKQKNCLNCGIMVKGRYCQRCGQENIVTKQTFWSILTHFVFDIFHFDGKFFSTLKTLFAKPGKVALGYVSGRRTKYLDPVRMYLFTSAFFFLIFFSFNDFDPVTTTGFEGLVSKSERLDAIMELNARNSKDSLKPIEKKALSVLLDSTMKVLFMPPKNTPGDSIVMLKHKPYQFFSEPDSSGYEAPVGERSWLDRILQKKIERLNKEHKDDPEKAFKDFGSEIVHRLPYLLFLSLPFFAMILKLIHFRKKQFYYSDHLVFTLYHYIFSFLMMLFLMICTALYKWKTLNIFLWLMVGGILYWLYYLYKGLRNFYGQSRGKTVVKFILLNLLGLVLFIFLVLVFVLFSFIEF